MSTSYEFFGRGKYSVTWKKLFETPGIVEEDSPHTTKTDRCIKSVGSKNYLWCDGNRKYVYRFSRYGANFVDEIINSIAIHTKVKIVSEHGAKFPTCPNVIKESNKIHRLIRKKIDTLIKRGKQK